MMEDLSKWAGESGTVHYVVTRDLNGAETGRVLIAMSGDVNLTEIALQLSANAGNRQQGSEQTHTSERAA